MANTAQSYADTLAHILDDFNGRFGPLPESGMKIAAAPGRTVPGMRLRLLLGGRAPMDGSAQRASARKPRGATMVGNRVAAAPLLTYGSR